MLRFGQVHLEPFLGAWVGWSVRHARAVLVVALLTTIALAYYTWTHLSINTDTDQMIDPDLPFRQVYKDFNQTFPQFADAFLMVVDAATAEEADAAARHLVAELHGRDELVMNAYAPGTGDFFEANGFLYLDPDELYALSDALADAEPVLAGLAEDPSLRGLFEVLVLALDDAMGRSGGSGGDPPERLARLLGDLTPSAQAAAAGTVRLLSWQELFQDGAGDIRDGRRRLVLVQPVLDFTSFQPARAALAEARRLAGQAEAATPGLRVRLTGKMAINAEELESVSSGARLSGAVSFLLVALILGFGIRSLRLVLAALATLAIGLIWTASFALAVIGYFNVISIAFAVLFIGLGIDFAIHFVLRYREEIWAGHASNEALQRTASGVGVPLALAAPTTAIAFYAFAPTAYSGLAQLGVISGTGMFISLFTSLTILPALIALMPLPPRMRDGAPVTAAGNPVGRLIERHGKAFAITGFVAGAIALSAVAEVRFDYDPMKLKDQETESVEAFQDLLARGKSSPYAAQILVADMAEAAALKTRLEALDGVSRVVTLAGYVPGDQEEKLEILSDTSIFMTPVLAALEPAAPPTPAQQQAALDELIVRLALLEDAEVEAALLLSARPLRQALELIAASEEAEDGGESALQRLEQGLLTFFPPVLDRIRRGLATTGVALDDLPADIRDRYQAADGRIRVEVFPTADLVDQAALTRFIDDVTAIHADVTGNAVQVKRAGEIVIDAMQQATATAALLIILFLLVLFRAARDVALILSPVVLAAAMTTAATVWLNIPFNFANVIVLPLLIGLGVDAGIHLVMRAREINDAREANNGLDSRQILTTSTPRAVLLSALTTVGSFGSLALSSHRGTASMGELLTISVFLTLACTLIVLPGLINWAYRRES